MQEKEPKQIYPQFLAFLAIIDWLIFHSLWLSLSLSLNILG